MTFIFRIEIYSSIPPPEAAFATSAYVRGPQLPQRTGPSVQGMGSSSKHRQEAALRSPQCDPSGCLLELMTQLTIIMGGQSIWNNIQEVLLPSKGIDVVLPSVYHSMLCVHSLNRYSVWVHQIICGLFPVAPLLALENNILEIRLGTWKLDYKL
ncbi:anoctamin-6-like isoform X3 [Vicugna pacos]|uniref:Anoctamin-6-like isoform X3 n=1 Tax=Vicugna pacos TaxID=30538 RepID=A0ABM5CY60_VICPA